jgi:hypothetical protein
MEARWLLKVPSHGSSARRSASGACAARKFETLRDFDLVEVGYSAVVALRRPLEDVLTFRKQHRL